MVEGREIMGSLLSQHLTRLRRIGKIWREGYVTDYIPRPTYTGSSGVFTYGFDTGKTKTFIFTEKQAREGRLATIDEFIENGDLVCCNCGDELMKDTHTDTDNNLWCDPCWYDKCLQENGVENE